MPSPETPPPLPPPPRGGRGVRARPRLAALAALAGVAALAGALAAYPPTRWAFWPKCVLHEATGWHCPGCGLSRAGCALLRGDAEAAFHHHPVFWLLTAPVAVYALYHAGYAVWHDRVSPRRLPPRLVAVLAGVFVVAGVLRNLPGFSFLGP